LQPLQPRQQRFQVRLVHRPGQPARPFHLHHPADRLLTAGPPHIRLMTLRHPGQRRIGPHLHRRDAALVLLGEDRPVVEAGHRGQDPVHRGRRQQPARPILPVGDHRQTEPLRRTAARHPPQERQQSQHVRRPEVLPVQALTIKEGEQVLQVIPVRRQLVRRELPIPKMIQEPADRPHRLAVITDQPYPADDAAIPLLDDPHPRLLASCRQQHRQRMRRRMTNGKESRKIPQQVVQIRMCWGGTPSPRRLAPGCARCAIRPRPARKADRMARLQDRAVRGAGTRGEVALDKLDRSAQVMRSLRRPARRCH